MLVVEDVHKHFAGVAALAGASLQAQPGEAIGLVGPNGSGKSTLLNIVSGFERSDRGKVILRGQEVSGRAPWDIASLGLVRTFQHAKLPTKMSVLELMLVGGRLARGSTLRRTLFDRRGVRREEAEARGKAWSILERIKLDGLAGQPGGKLSGGQQKLLSLGMALMGDPTLLLLDEPTAGVNPTLRVQLAQHLRDLQGEGMTLLIVEHDMRFIADTCDRVYVLDRGQMLTCCPPAELSSHPEVLEAYLGRSGGQAVVSATRRKEEA